LLKIRGNEDGQERRAEKLVSKSNASVGLGGMPSIPLVVYTSRALITAEFREMSSDDSKDGYLASFDKALRESNIRSRLLTEDYRYLLGDAMYVEQAVQRYFNEEIARTIRGLFQDLGDEPLPPHIRSKRRIQPDIIHMLSKSELNTQYLEIVLG